MILQEPNNFFPLHRKFQHDKLMITAHRCGSFSSVPELISAINEYLKNHNQNPQVFVWSASVEKILGKINKCKEALDALH